MAAVKDGKQAAGRAPRSAVESILASMMVPAYLAAFGATFYLIGLLVSGGASLPAYFTFFYVLFTGPVIVIAALVAWANLCAGRRRPGSGPSIDAFVAAVVGFAVAVSVTLPLVVLVIAVP